MAEKKKNIHTGHRARLRQKFIDTGNLDNFDDHQILEMLLFYAYPMKDTNEIAHKLISEYGSLYNLFNRPVKDLMNRMNVTENVATLISMMPHLYKRYLRSEINDGKPINTSAKAKKFLRSYLVGQDYESFVVVNLDVKKRVIAVDVLTDNEVSEVSVSSRTVIERALLNRAKFVIIGHNHPAGTNKPSSADVSMFRRLREEYKMIGVTILDNIIICNQDSYSFYEHKTYGLTYNPEL